MNSAQLVTSLKVKYGIKKPRNIVIRNVDSTSYFTVAEREQKLAEIINRTKTINIQNINKYAKVILHKLMVNGFLDDYKINNPEMYSIIAYSLNNINLDKIDNFIKKKSYKKYMKVSHIVFEAIKPMVDAFSNKNTPFVPSAITRGVYAGRDDKIYSDYAEILNLGLAIMSINTNLTMKMRDYLDAINIYYMYILNDTLKKFCINCDNGDSYYKRIINDSADQLKNVVHIIFINTNFVCYATKHSRDTYCTYAIQNINMVCSMLQIQKIMSPEIVGQISFYAAFMQSFLGYEFVYDKEVIKNMYERPSVLGNRHNINLNIHEDLVTYTFSLIRIRAFLTLIHNTISINPYFHEVFSIKLYENLGCVVMHIIYQSVIVTNHYKKKDITRLSFESAYIIMCIYTSLLYTKQTLDEGLLKVLCLFILNFIDLASKIDWANPYIEKFATKLISIYKLGNIQRAFHVKNIFMLHEADKKIAGKKEFVENAESVYKILLKEKMYKYTHNIKPYFDEPIIFYDESYSGREPDIKLKIINQNGEFIFKVHSFILAKVGYFKMILQYNKTNEITINDYDENIIYYYLIILYNNPIMEISNSPSRISINTYVSSHKKIFISENDVISLVKLLDYMCDHDKEFMLFSPVYVWILSKKASDDSLLKKLMVTLKDEYIILEISSIYDFINKLPNFQKIKDNEGHLYNMYNDLYQR
jgi:hypothetical protein